MLSWAYIIFIGKRILEVDFPPLSLYCADLYPAQGVVATARFMLRKPVATAFWKQKSLVDKIPEKDSREPIAHFFHFYFIFLSFPSPEQLQ